MDDVRSDTASLPGSPRRGWFRRSLGRARTAYATIAKFLGQRAWSRAAVKFVRETLTREEYFVVVSSGPPHTAHLASSTIGKSREALVVLDFRDPWSLVERLPGHLDAVLSRRLSQFLEPRVVKSADLLVMNTSMATAKMRRVYPTKNVITVMNGFDDNTTSRGSDRLNSTASSSEGAAIG